MPVTLSSETAVVHLEYDILNPPAKLSEKWTRFVCISDTHSRTFPVPPGDVLLHSGDLTETGQFKQFKVTTDWLNSLPHPLKIIIAGNHDLTLDADWYDKNHSRWSKHRSKEELEPILDLLKGYAARQANLVYLQDEKYEFQTKPSGRTWSVYGSPWTPNFCNWAFNYNRVTDAERLISAFPKTDILLTHGPPAEIFDKTISSSNVGCETLTAHLPLLRPRLHLFGHIHEAHGAAIHKWPSEISALAEDNANLSEIRIKGDQTVFVNGANWPTGSRGKQGNRRPGFGTAPFQPVIVDLLDGA